MFTDMKDKTIKNAIKYIAKSLYPEKEQRYNIEFDRMERWMDGDKLDDKQQSKHMLCYILDDIMYGNGPE
jgi:hypothetical protein